MRIPKWCLVLLMSVSCSAQTVQRLEDTRAPVGEPVRPVKQDGVPRAAPGLESQPMPGEHLSGATLEAALDAIRAANPAFNSVIVRDPSMPGDYPMLPAMKLKNVTVGQFLQFVQASFPGVQCMRIDGPDGSLYSIRIRKDDAMAERMRVAMDQNTVRLYRLTDIVNALADETASRDKAAADNKDAKEIGRAERIKTATADVLSLFQAALDQTDQDGPCKLNVHEPTLTLLFKGSNAKQRVLEEAMSSLTPRYSSRGGGRGGVSYPLPSAANPFDASSNTFREADSAFKQMQGEREKQLAEWQAVKAKEQQQTKPSPAPK